MTLTRAAQAAYIAAHTNTMKLNPPSGEEEDDIDPELRALNAWRALPEPYRHHWRLIAAAAIKAKGE